VNSDIELLSIGRYRLLWCVAGRVWCGSGWSDRGLLEYLTEEALMTKKQGLAEMEILEMPMISDGSRMPGPFG
jgi:hypothetical protein